MAATPSPFLAQIIAAKGVNFDQVKLLGCGQWNDNRIKTKSTLYRRVVSLRPTRAVSMPSPRAIAPPMASIRSRPRASATTPPSSPPALPPITGAALSRASTITDPNGFRGIDGAFRFLSNGTNQRSLAIYQINPNGVQIIDPAPNSFAPVVGGGGGGGIIGGLFGNQ